MMRTLALVVLAHLALIPAAERPVPYERVVPFRHLDHVRSDWAVGDEPEYPRDCRGCHRYEEQGTTDPQQVCARCHRDGSLAVDFEKTPELFRTGLSHLREDRPFDHQDHGRFDCKRCHDPIEGSPRSRGEQGEMQLKRGWHTCLECHDPDSTKARPEDKTTGDAAVAFIKALDDALGKVPLQRRAPFRHDQHLGSLNASGSAACLTCHKSLVHATERTIGANQVDDSACGNCHRTSITPPVSAKTIIERRDHQSPFAGTFPHNVHLTEAARSKDSDLEQGCVACHVYEKGRANYGLKRAFKGEDTYTACDACHEKSGILRVVDGNGVVDHGQVESCAPCHDLGQGPMATVRPKVQVNRHELRMMTFVSNDHPFITMKDGEVEVAESCRKCHLAKIEGGLPSRIPGKRFSHDTHLPANATSDDCNACHASIATADTAEAVMRFEVDRCNECHRGTRIVLEEVRKPLLEKAVPRFPHLIHMASDKVSGCGDCHVPAQNGDPVAGTLSDALDCTKCHNHGNASEITGGKDRAYVDSCVTCHGPSAFAQGQVVSDFRRITIGLEGHQKHPLPGQQACSDCHLPGEPVVEPGRKAPHVFARLEYSPRDRTGFHGKFDPNRIYKAGGRCGACHWEELMGTETKPLTGTRMNRADAIRLGRESLGDFPGGKR